MNSEVKRIVLVIDSGTKLRDFGRDVLRKSFQVVEAETGEDGLLLARQILPELVLCDTKLSGLNGLDICIKLKSDVMTDHMSVIMLGAGIDQELESLEAKADDFVVQPFNRQVLELKIENQMRLREALRVMYMREMSLQPGVSELDGGFLDKLKQLVFDNISNPDFGVHEMAFQIGISVSVLYRKLKVLTGITVNEFVKTMRMKRALSLLESGTYHVNEVATAVGYEDSKYFSREFRKTFGKTPTEIKRRGFEKQ